MPPKGGKRKAELERLAEEARLAKLAEQQRMMEERLKAKDENAVKGEQEKQWVEQQNASFLMEEQEHLQSLHGVASAVDSCEEGISKTDEWRRFVACSRLPDPMSEKDVNSYITLLRDQELDTDIHQSLQLFNNIQHVSDDLDSVVSSSRIAGEGEKVDAYVTMIESLQTIGWQKLNYATSWAMQNPMTFVNAQNVVKVESRVENIKLGLFINVTKALRSRTLDFPDCGFSCDLPRALVTGDIGIRFLQTSQDPLSACHPNGDLIALGGVLYVQILGMPSAPVVTNRGWMMRKAIVGDDPMGLQLLTYPLSHEGTTAAAARDVPPIKISFFLPTEIFLDTMQPRVGRWNYETKMWEEDGIFEVSLDMPARLISFKTSVITTETAFACVMHRSCSFPYKKWLMSTPVDDMTSLVLETQTHSLNIEVHTGLVRLVSPMCPELEGLIGLQMRPASLLLALRKRGINLMPANTDREAMKSVGVVPKTPDVEGRACYNAASVAAGFAVASSHWNAGLSAHDCMFRVRESLSSTEVPVDDENWRVVIFRSKPLAAWMMSRRTEKDEIFYEEPLTASRGALLVINLLKGEADQAAVEKCRAASGVHNETIRKLLELLGVFSFTAGPTKPGALTIPDLRTVARVNQVDSSELDAFLSGGDVSITPQHGERWLHVMDALNIAGERSFHRGAHAAPPVTRVNHWPHVVIFLASTLKDMGSERDYLHRYIFPAIRAKCYARQIHFSVIDLLWGVNQEIEAYKKLGIARVLKITEGCLLSDAAAVSAALSGASNAPGGANVGNNSSGVLPPGSKIFSLVLLGDRAGWTPARESIERQLAASNVPGLSWVNKPPHNEDSMLAMLVQHAILRRGTATTEPFCCIRDQSVFQEAKYKEEVPLDVRNLFADEKVRVTDDTPPLKLKTMIRTRIPTRCYDGYPVVYDKFVPADPVAAPPPAEGGAPGEDGAAAVPPGTPGADGTVPPGTPGAAAAAADGSAASADGAVSNLANGSVKLSGLELFGARVFRQLWGSISNALPENRAPPELVPTSRSEQEQLVDIFARNFQGQEDAVTKIRECIHGTSCRSPIVVLLGPTGSGRTSILARVCQTLRTDDNVKVIPFFKLKSMGMYTMLEYLALELESNKEIEDTDESGDAKKGGGAAGAAGGAGGGAAGGGGGGGGAKSGAAAGGGGGAAGAGGGGGNAAAAAAAAAAATKVKEGSLQDASGRLLIGTDMFLEALRRNVSKKRQTQIVLVLDGLEKTELSQISYCAGRDQFLESKFRCVVAASEGVSDHNKDSIININEGLNEKEGSRIATSLLALHDRRLDLPELELLLKKEQASSPFYLSLAADEIAHVPPAESIRDKLDLLPGTVEDVYGEMILPRLENMHGAAAVKSVLSWLVVTSYGLQESDLLMLLQQTSSTPMPQGEFIALCEALRSILEPTQGEERHVLSIGHSMLRDAIIKRYLSDERELQRSYQLVAAMLMTQADPTRKGQWDVPAYRAYRALPEVFLGGKMWVDLMNSLGALRFLEMYIRACGVPMLMSELVNAIKITEVGSPLANQKIRRYHEFIEAHVLLLHSDPSCIYQMALSATEQDIKNDLLAIQQELLMRVEQAERGDYDQSTPLQKALSLDRLFSCFVDAADRGVLRCLPTEKVDTVAAAASKIASLREELWVKMDPAVSLPPFLQEMGGGGGGGGGGTTERSVTTMSTTKGSKGEKGEEDLLLKALTIEELHKIAMLQDQPTPGLRLVMQAMCILLNVIPPIPPPPNPKEPVASIDSSHPPLLALTKAELGEMKALTARPPPIAAIAQGMCLVLGLAPVVKRGAEDWWTPCKKLLGNVDVLKRMTDAADLFTNGDNYPSDALWNFLSDFVDNPAFSMNEVRATKIACAAVIASWLRSLFNWLSTSPMGAMVVFRARRIIEVETFDHWRAANKLFHTWTHIDALVQYNKKGVTLATIRQLEPVVTNYMFDANEIAKVSTAAAILCLWVKEIVDNFLDPSLLQSLIAAVQAAQQTEQPEEPPKPTPGKPAKKR